MARFSTNRTCARVLPTAIDARHGTWYRSEVVCLLFEPSLQDPLDQTTEVRPETQ